MANSRKSLFLDPPFELVGGEEVVIASVDLTLARLPRGRGNGELEVRYSVEQFRDQGALADTRRTGDYEDLGHQGRGY